MLLKEKQFKVLGMLALIGGVSILLSFITDRSICIFYNTTGVPCPSCGMTRAFMHLFEGDIKGAFWFHPLFPLVFLTPFIVFVSKKRYIYLAIFIVLSTWIIRLALYFPNRDPLVFMNSALAPKFKNIVISLVR